jgi:hypothetical protein
LVESGASSKISALSAAAALSGAETVPILQGGATVAATAVNIANAGSGMPSGNANPAQPAYGNNRLFLRTDLGLVIYYDGTRWLTAEQFAAPLSNIVAAEPYGATQVNALWGIVPGVPTYEFYLETLEFTTYNSVITAGTLFFTLALETLNGAGAVTTIARVSGAALSTSGDTQATYIKKITVFNSVIPVTAMMLNVSATKTGGGVSVLYLVGCAFGRKIIT